MAADIAAVFRQMHLNGMYREILFVADTCQAFTLGDKITAPNVTILGSSLKGESSYAYGSNTVLGLAPVERYTHALAERLNQGGGKYLQESIQTGMIDPFSFEYLSAHIGVKDDLAKRKVTEARISDFFVNVQSGRRPGQQQQHHQHQLTQQGDLKLLGHVQEGNHFLPIAQQQQLPQQTETFGKPDGSDDSVLHQNVSKISNDMNDFVDDRDWSLEPGSVTFLAYASLASLGIYALTLVL